MRRLRGFSLIEILIAAVVASIVFLSFMSVFRSSYQYARMTRNRAVGILLGRSLLDEVEAHPYGAPAPRNWADGQDVPARIWIEGRPVTMIFHKKFSYRNASFVGKSKKNEDFDVVTIMLSWKEAVGPQKLNAVGDTQELRLTVPVWR